MKKLLFVVLMCSLPSLAQKPVLPFTGDTKIDTVMTANEKRDIGYDHMDVSEKASLQQWITKYANQLYNQGQSDIVERYTKQADQARRLQARKSYTTPTPKKSSYKIPQNRYIYHLPQNAFVIPTTPSSSLPKNLEEAAQRYPDADLYEVDAKGNWTPVKVVKVSR